MRVPRLVLLVVLAATVGAAETYAVVGVAGADRVVVNFRGLPVQVALAHLEVPEAQRVRCTERLKELVRGKKAELQYLPEFGADPAGAARVHLVVDKTDVAEALVAAGVAKYQPGEKRAPTYEDALKKAQDKAQQAKVGLWAAGSAAAAPATTAAAAPAAKPAAPVAAAKPAAPARGPFCSELDSPFYQPTDDPAVAQVAANRLIFYPDEATAQRAGKRKREDVTAALPEGADEKTADAIYAQAEDIYRNAIAAGNSDKRDQLYEQSFQVFSRAMTIYGALVDQRPDDEALAEKLRRCMQLRYGSMKQRRAH